MQLTACGLALEDGCIWLPKLLKEHCGFASSNSDARRLIEQGAVQINGEKITDTNCQLKVEDGMILQVGKKKRFARLTLMPKKTEFN